MHDDTGSHDRISQGQGLYSVYVFPGDLQALLISITSLTSIAKSQNLQITCVKELATYNFLFLVQRIHFFRKIIARQYFQ